MTAKRVRRCDRRFRTGHRCHHAAVYYCRASRIALCADHAPNMPNGARVVDSDRYASMSLAMRNAQDASLFVSSNSRMALDIARILHDAVRKIDVDEFSAVYRELAVCSEDYLRNRAWPWFSVHPEDFLLRFNGKNHAELRDRLLALAALKSIQPDTEQAA